MSGTQPAPDPTPPDPAPPPAGLWTQQSVMAYLAMILVFMIIGKILWSGTSELQSQVLILASTTVGALITYYFRTTSAPHPAPPPTAALATNTAALKDNTAATVADTGKVGGV